MAPARRRFVYQFRLVWRYKGDTRDRHRVSDQAYVILKSLRKIGTSEPWRGCDVNYMKQVWAIAAMRLGVPFEVAAEMSLKQAIVAVQASYPKLEFIRVEMRQVGDWTKVLDPLRTLATRGTEAAEKRRTQKMAEVDQFSPTQLDAWRWRPESTTDKFLGRKR